MMTMTEMMMTMMMVTMMMMMMMPGRNGDQGGEHDDGNEQEAEVNMRVGTVG